MIKSIEEETTLTCDPTLMFPSSTFIYLLSIFKRDIKKLLIIHLFSVNIFLTSNCLFIIIIITMLIIIFSYWFLV